MASRPAPRLAPAAFAVALALAAGLAATPAAAGDERGVDCAFFEGQAFNKPEGHFALGLARLCAMLSDYKAAVTGRNAAAFAAERAAEADVDAPPRRMRDLPRTGESGSYLIAREIGLIDMLAAVEAR